MTAPVFSGYPAYSRVRAALPSVRLLASPRHPTESSSAAMARQLPGVLVRSLVRRLSSDARTPGVLGRRRRNHPDGHRHQEYSFQCLPRNSPLYHGLSFFLSFLPHPHPVFQESLGISLPYAFNYHLDQTGAFRGLAFANFRHAPDADAVVAALNGFDVQGRRLRVEYKKVLQAGEKERIEREKAIRRMRSMQLEKEQHAQLTQLYDDFSSSFTRPFSSPYTPQPGPPLAPPPSAVPQPSTTPASEKALNELDMNDPSTLEIYSRVLLFKDDPMRDELAFSRSLSSKQRRVVHLIAQKLGVFHYSVGEGDDRYAVVTRTDPQKVCVCMSIPSSPLTTSGNLLAAVPSTNPCPQPHALCLSLPTFSRLCPTPTSPCQKVHA